MVSSEHSSEANEPETQPVLVLYPNGTHEWMDEFVIGDSRFKWVYPEIIEQCFQNKYYDYSSPWTLRESGVVVCTRFEEAPDIWKRAHDRLALMWVNQAKWMNDLVLFKIKGFVGI